MAGPQASAVFVPPAEEFTIPELRFATQTIVDAQGQVAGSELLFRWNSADAPVSPHLGAYATATALCNALLDGQWLTELRPDAPVGSLCVNMDERYLLSPMAEALTPDVGVIELLETMTLTPEVRRRVQALHQRGYRFSLDDVESSDDPRWALAEFVESVKVDVRATPADQLEPMIRMARTSGLRVVAEKVETDEEKACLVSHGVALFQGYAIQRPVTQRVRALPGCQAPLLGLLYEQAQDGAKVEALSVLAESDPALVLRLLRLQALHAPREVALSLDMTDVLASLPRPVLVGWLTQMNVAAVHGRGRERVLLAKQAQMRFCAQLQSEPGWSVAARRRRLFAHYRALVQTL
ncbi:EAL domain-containing protein [Roseateles sp. SL47]|uniref:EAL and HDOD domain-containing protein n=1 Tax=Roseateles sp. SL47 TaxID=2995138 RepID=UPI00226E9286|nr:EAL domain-containing protein [Roseateles sp. SL47]WAC71790.1 EAL domain-containing protein [Roseateles sp. SL47]